VELPSEVTAGLRRSEGGGDDVNWKVNNFFADVTIFSA
jgi:hypothetical protein